MSAHSESDTQDGAETFSSIRTPSIRGQLDNLAQDAPIDTQAGGASLQKGMFAKLRKAKGTVDIEHTFKFVFGKQEFKGKQRDIMTAAINGMDVLAIAPTGMGKSLCFQVPAVAEEHGLTLVVTPLLALMANQVQALESLNIPAAMLTSKTDEFEKKAIEKDMKSGHPRIRLLYITPERLAMDKFQNLLKKVYAQGELSRLVIDEAHCISEWGHDFRKEYQQIGRFRELFEKVPIMALTASATKVVQDDIITSLDMRLDRLYKIVHSFNRANLFYEVRYVQDSLNTKVQEVTAFVQNLYRRKLRRGAEVSEESARQVSGIVYCRAKKTCDMVADALRKKGINAAAFHRGMKDTDADRNARLWKDAEVLAKDNKKRVDCIVATVAFGMGIDAPGCRYVIHFDLPTSFEGFYQETGRAGRDGHAARCLLFYSRQDAEVVKLVTAKTHKSRANKSYLPAALANGSKNSLEELLKFVENVTECRHIAICKYFGEKPKMDIKTSYCDRFCDICKSPEAVKAAKKALDPPDVVATQMPAFEREAEEQWSDEDAARERTIARTESSTSAASVPDQAVAGLPGFQKASKFAAQAPAANMEEEPGKESETETEELFPSFALQAHEEAAQIGPYEPAEWSEEGILAANAAVSLEENKRAVKEPMQWRSETSMDLDGTDEIEKDDGDLRLPPPLNHPVSKSSTVYKGEDMQLEEDEAFFQAQSLPDEDEAVPFMDEKGREWHAKAPTGRDEENGDAMQESESQAAPDKASWQRRKRPFEAPRGTQMDQPSSSSSPPPAPYALARPLQSAMAGPNLIARVAPSEIVDIDSDSDEDLPALPRGPSPKRQALVANGTGVQGSGKVRHLVQPKTTLGSGSKSYGHGNESKSGGFKVPFKDATNGLGHVEELPQLEDAPISKDISFKLVPERWTKKVTEGLRKDAIRQCHALLCKAFLASGGIRASSEEEELFSKLRASTAVLRQKDETMLFAALELESDVFWTTISPGGYTLAVTRHLNAIKSIIKSSAWLHTFPTSADPALDDVFKATMRATRLHKHYESGQLTKRRSSSEEDSD